MAKIILALFIYDFCKAGVKAVIELIHLNGYIEGAEKVRKRDYSLCKQCLINSWSTVAYPHSGQVALCPKYPPTPST